MRNLLRKVFLWLGALFWSKRFRISSVVASSFALQAFACAYGTDEPCEKDCYDPSLNCKPVYDTEKFSGKDYSECEQSLADSLKYIAQCNGSIPCKNTKAEPEDWLFTATQPTWVCLDEKPADCSNETTNIKQQFVDSLEWECSLDHLKADSSLVGYRCADSYETISIEEGEKRRQEYMEWKDRIQGS
jgi:hypothetical protein